MKYIKVLACIIGLASMAELKAQQTGSAPQQYSFSVQQAVDFALQNNVGVKNALLDISIAKQQVNELLGAGLPQLNASGDLKYYAKAPIVNFPNFGNVVYSILEAEQLLNNPKPNLPATIQASFFPKFVATGSVDASQLVFDGGYIIGVKASKKYNELTKQNAEQIKIETSANIRKSYYNVLVGNERLEILNTNVTRLEKLLNDTKALLENGFVEKIDADRLEVSLNNLKTERDNIVRLLSLGSYVLKFQLGMNADDQLTLTDKLEDVDVKSFALIQSPTDAGKRIEYSVLQTTQSLQQLNIKRYQYGYLPSVVAYGSVQAQALRNEFDIFDTKKGWFPVGLIGGTIKIPIFDGLQKSAKIKQERFTLIKLQNGMEQLKNAIALETTTANINLENALSSLETQSRNKKLAEEIMRVSKIKYDEGVGSNIEVVNAESSLRESVSNYYNALYNAIVAKIDLDKATGNIK